MIQIHQPSVPGLENKGQGDDEAEGENELMDKLRRSFALDSYVHLNFGVELQAGRPTARALKPTCLLI